jgi:beta-phosphoglucomutase-like phosphatase (HAD superfamily)
VLLAVRKLDAAVQDVLVAAALIFEDAVFGVNRAS